MGPGSRTVSGGPERARRAQRWLAVVAFLGVGAGTAGGWVLTTRDAEEDAEQLADALADETAATLETIVGRAVAGLQGAAALAATDGTVDGAAFRAFAEGILDERSLGAGLGVRVDGADRAAFEADVGPILALDRDGALGPAPEVEEYFPIVEVASPDPSVQRVVGFDYATHEMRRSVLRAAIDAGQPVLSPPTELAPNSELGFVAVQPLYRRGAAVDTVAQRRAAAVGFVTVAHRADELLPALQRTVPAGTGVSVRDGDTVLLDTGPGGAPELARPRTIMVPGREWAVRVVPPEGASTVASTYVLVGGVLAEVGLLLLFGVTIRYQRRLRTAYGAQRLAQQRSETLEGLAARLSRSLSGVEVGQALLEQLPPFTGTTAGAVLVLDEDGDRLDLLAADGYDPPQIEAIREVDLSVPSAVADAVHRGEAAWLPSPLAWRDDEVTAAFGAAGRAAAIVPLVADRDVVGVLVLVHPGVRGFYEDERSLLLTVAALAARAITRARRYDAEHDAAGVLQRALLPSRVPELDGVAVAVRYLPATGGLNVGGDWYDVFAVRGGRVGVVVGDVVGRGVKAAAAMGRLRSAMRALADVVPEPEELLAAFEAHVPTIPDAFCATMVYAVVDPVAGSVIYVRAGHPPPLLVRAGAEVGAEVTVEVLDAGGSPPLGVRGAAPADAATVRMGPGDTLLLYTDGIVERRGEPVTVGVERLREAAAASCHLTAHACADAIVDAMLGGGHTDDAALVALRLAPEAAVSGSVVRGVRVGSR